MQQFPGVRIDAEHFTATTATAGGVAAICIMRLDFCITSPSLPKFFQNNKIPLLVQKVGAIHTEQEACMLYH
jgi:hypothetical protein